MNKLLFFIVGFNLTYYNKQKSFAMFPPISPYSKAFILYSWGAIIGNRKSEHINNNAYNPFENTQRNTQLYYNILQEEAGHRTIIILNLIGECKGDS
jgi:hypothetical protein